MEGEKIVRADDKDELDRAKREVTLDINEKNGVVRLYVNGPFRGPGQSGDHGFHDRDGHYEVIYNLTVHVPRQTELRLRDVNGSVRAERTTGKFDVRDVNGSMTMTSMGGTGNARTVNGSLTLSFTESPGAPDDFSTVNGRIEATFPPSLRADLRLKTVNGSAYTDFDGTALATPATADKRDGMTIYRPKGSAHLRVGGGGPELSFSTVNGSIGIRKGTIK